MANPYADSYWCHWLLMNFWRSRAYKLGSRKIFSLLILAVSLGYWLAGGQQNLINWSTQSEAMNASHIIPSPSAAQPALKKILYWTTYFGTNLMTMGLGQEPFIAYGCPVTNCWATDDRSLLNDTDAIIFHAYEMNRSDVPAHRLPHQRYIFFLYEAMQFGGKFSLWPDQYFNWTMSYRRDSDIYSPQPHGVLRRKFDSPCQPRLPPTLAPRQKLVASAQLMLPALAINHSRLANKKKLMAWFCSHQYTNSKREEYVSELVKHIPVDIYGKCGNLTCLPRDQNPKCNSLLDNYKFYLAAENSLCPEYITEKFYRVLNSSDVVPVVYGGGDYAAFAPPNSYINVADFRSPRELADYLKLLDKNDALYLKYFEWKKDYEVHYANKKPRDGVCELCKKLNDPDEPVKIYENIKKYWVDGAPCLSGETFLRDILHTTPMGAGD